MKTTLELKPSLGVRVSQRLALTPQIQQALRMLQMGSLELQQEISDALESNIMLERADENPEETSAEGTGESEPEAAGDTTQELSKTLGEPVASAVEQNGDSNGELEFKDIPAEPVIDVSWEQIYGEPTGVPTGRRGDVDWTEGVSAAAPGLRGQLLGEIPLLDLDARGQAMAMMLVDALDTRGYLGESLGDLARALAPEVKTNAAELEKVLQQLRGLAPPGVGARDLRECLLLQLHQLPARTPWLRETCLLVENHLELAGTGDNRKLARLLKVDQDQLVSIFSLLQSLDPQPGQSLEPPAPELLIPDLIVRRTAEGWLVEANPEAMPRLRINGHYAELARTVRNAADAGALQAHLREARGLLHNLERRTSTLLRVARCIISRQHAFLERGPEVMKPLVLRAVAEELDLHETTVSRATIGKYIFTPRGTFELKYFFSSQLQGRDGSRVSSTAVRALLRKLIEAEPSHHPHSDAKLSQLLHTNGIRVARRTVAKYRDSMTIPGCSERRRHARAAGNQAAARRTPVCR